MADGEQVAESAARRYVMLRPHLNERQRRLLLGVEATQLGRGGVKAVARATGVHPDTVARGVREVDGVAEPSARVRAAGGGRKRLAETDPALAVALKALVDPETRGDPMSLLVWTTKSTRNVAGDALVAMRHLVADASQAGRDRLNEDVLAEQVARYRSAVLIGIEQTAARWSGNLMKSTTPWPAACSNARTTTYASPPTGRSRLTTTDPNATSA